MPYVGGKLEPLFDREPVKRALHKMADKGGEVMTRRIKENTPVKTGRLRDSIRQKPVVIAVDTLGNVIYESGTHTHLNYAPYVEHGTGLWGPKHARYAIYPRKPGGVLAFHPYAGGLHPVTGDPLTGGMIFVKKVMHPGSPGNHMFLIGAAMTRAELRSFVQPILVAWTREQAELARAQQR